MTHEKLCFNSTTDCYCSARCDQVSHLLAILFEENAIHIKRFAYSQKQNTISKKTLIRKREKKTNITLKSAWNGHCAKANARTVHTSRSTRQANEILHIQH